MDPLLVGFYSLEVRLPMSASVLVGTFSVAMPHLPVGSYEHFHGVSTSCVPRHLSQQVQRLTMTLLA